MTPAQGIYCKRADHYSANKYELRLNPCIAIAIEYISFENSILLRQDHFL
ncbi:hypothetical protein PSPO_b1197 [Pseudoalteromonas spongiae UST010723-006]|nr:hypothetical protein PSPO_b1197 [Pseudoalteromonas spongiae UST010723-006]